MSDYYFLSLGVILPTYKFTHEFQHFYTVLEFAMSLLVILKLMSKTWSLVEGLMYMSHLITENGPETLVPALTVRAELLHATKQRLFSFTETESIATVLQVPGSCFKAVHFFVEKLSWASIFNAYLMLFFFLFFFIVLLTCTLKFMFSRGRQSSGYKTTLKV